MSATASSRAGVVGAAGGDEGEHGAAGEQRDATHDAILARRSGVRGRGAEPAVAPAARAGSAHRGRTGAAAARSCRRGPRRSAGPPRGRGRCRVFLPCVTKGSKSRSRDLRRAPPGPRRRARARGRGPGLAARGSTRAQVKPAAAAHRVAGVGGDVATPRAAACRRRAHAWRSPGTCDVAAPPRAPAAPRRGRPPARRGSMPSGTGAPRQPPAAAGEVEGLGGHPLEPVDIVDDQLGARAAPPRRGSAGIERASRRSRGSPSSARGSRGPACRPWCRARPGAPRRSAPAGRAWFSRASAARRGDQRDEPRLGVGEGALRGAAPGPRTSMPTRPLRARRGTRVPSPGCPGSRGAARPRRR